MHYIKSNSEKKNKFMYILEAAFEYLISVLVSNSFLATLTKQLGISDSLTGILSSIISLGCLFQLISITIGNRNSKRLVVLLSIINQVLFMLLYIIPLSRASDNVKTVAFIICIVLAYLIYNIAHPKKINWLMSHIDDSQRGIFTANKEIVSLIIGMVFSLVMSAVVDHYIEQGKVKTAFIIAAVVIFALTVLHTVALLLTDEKEVVENTGKRLKENLRDILNDKQILKVTAVVVVYNVANYVSVPFYSTYQLNELGLSLTFMSIMSVCTSVVRALASKPWGRYADKNSFAVMLQKCFYFLILQFVCFILTTASNAKIMMVIFYIFHGIAIAGVNSSLMNMVFDYSPVEKRADTLAISQAASGLAGFLATLAVSPLVSLIQRKGLHIFGITVYAQQVISLISLVIIIFLIAYLKTFKKESKNNM
ncbi:MAG: MFS transporter [Acutalibacteraceae bacterium]|nr:MFS transporter [Acutalibacteraceae bacterium]